ncbi:hypothetical protein [Paenibacillus sp. UMB4589-SE434]|uniref:hypothetical protein n=1 Tax=Paenibacillus sp. UMB4589-SE434 TaxID=3046314 RepID=UPI00254A7583|nr:hypothetical protein [Paenibacillus sp. UMB4589-SE434]MDK8182133.1 hypothetical protein [Paenibacillus sp. UMB4589-SE434]
MKIWEISANPANTTIVEAEDNLSSFSDIELYKGLPLGGEWVPFKVQTYQEGSRMDFYNYYGGIPVITEKTYEILKPYMENQVEFLPIIYDQTVLYAMNVTNVIDAIDYRSIKVSKMPSGKLNPLDTYHFNNDKIKDIDLIFKIPEQVSTSVFVTSKFVDLLNMYKLEGPSLYLVWDKNIPVQSAATAEMLLRYDERLSQLNICSRIPLLSFNDVIENLKVTNKQYRSKEYKLKYQFNKVFISKYTNLSEFLWRPLHYVTPEIAGLLWHEDDTNDFGEFI